MSPDIDINDLANYVFNSSADAFKKDFNDKIIEICSSMKACYNALQKFEKHNTTNERFLYIQAHVDSIVDALFISIKLLAHGFLPSSGNQFRVAIEAMSVSWLLSHTDDISIKNENKNFFDGFLKKEEWTKPHRAVAYAYNNSEKLGMPREIMDILKKSKDYYNNYSHISHQNIRSKIVASNKILLGGGYMPEQKGLFSIELEIRDGFTKIAPILLDKLYKKVTSQEVS